MTTPAREGRRVPTVRWAISCGRHFLEVSGYVVAMEGDPCREAKFTERFWTAEAIKRVAREAGDAD